jgi:3',5'-cyclic AMP phosphodiesterase CpdA
VVLGDTQRTTLPEQLLLGREQNERARQALIAKLAREERPAFVVHLGDLVSVGASAREWRYFDRLVGPLAARGIRIRPVLGNHDYWGPRTLALRHAQQRFPELAQRTFGALREGELGLIWLDSNLKGAAAAQQLRWFESTLSDYEHDPELRGVLAFAHHPPFSNARRQERPSSALAGLLGPFFAAGKTLALLAGHVHGYERFEVRGKTFVVSGGAGGPRVSYRTGSDARYPPAYVTADGTARAFHYLVIQAEAERLHVDVKCLELDAACSAGRLETFCLPLRAAPAAPPR